MGLTLAKNNIELDKTLNPPPSAGIRTGAVAK